MKKITLLLLFIAMIHLFTYGQTSRFYVNKATTVSSECSCSTLKSIKVTIPIPAGVSSFDGYYLYITLNSIDVPAYIFFDKKSIASKLVGKKEYSAFLLKEDGTSDFTFEDMALSLKDICSTPRMWGKTEVTLDASGAGYKIIGYHMEDKWNEYYKKWESTKTEDWDEGVAFGEGVLTIAQRPLSEGFSDENDFILVKASDVDSCSYSVSSEVEVKGALSIEDKSKEFQTDITYAYFQNQGNSYEELKKIALQAMSGKFQVGPVHNFYWLMNMNLDAKKVVPGKSSEFSKIVINGISYETASYAQNKTKENSSYNPSDIGGFYATYFIAKVGTYDVIIVSLTKDIEPTDDVLKKIDEITFKWLNATTYKTIP